MPWCCPPCLKKHYPFHNCSTIITISSCTSTSSLPSAPSPNHWGIEKPVSPIVGVWYRSWKTYVHVQATSLNPCVIASTDWDLPGCKYHHSWVVHSWILCPTLWQSVMEVVFSSILGVIEIWLRQGKMLISIFIPPPLLLCPPLMNWKPFSPLWNIHPSRLKPTIFTWWFQY